MLHERQSVYDKVCYYRYFFLFQPFKLVSPVYRGFSTLGTKRDIVPSTIIFDFEKTAFKRIVILHNCIYIFIYIEREREDKSIKVTVRDCVDYAKELMETFYVHTTSIKINCNIMK